MGPTTRESILASVLLHLVSVYYVARLASKTHLFLCVRSPVAWTSIDGDEFVENDRETRPVVFDNHQNAIRIPGYAPRYALDRYKAAAVNLTAKSNSEAEHD